MARQLVLAAFGLGLLALTVGLFIPAVIDADQETTREAVELDINESTLVDDIIRYELDAANVTNGTANLTVTDTSSYTEAKANLTEGDTVNISLPDDEVSVTLVSVESDGTARIQPDQPYTYGWNSSAKTFLAEIDTIMVLIGTIIMLGGVGSVVY